jgi:hypothetical protein
MQNQLESNKDNPEALEALYQSDKQGFRKAFDTLPSERDSLLLSFWRIRLAQYSKKNSNLLSTYDIYGLIGIALIVGTCLRIPFLTPEISHNFFYPRNLATLFFFGLTAYMCWINRFNQFKPLVLVSIAALLLILQVNLLVGDDAYPRTLKSDSIINALIATPILALVFFAVAFMDFDWRNHHKRITFIRYMADLIITTGLLFLTGLLLTAILFGLFELLHVDIFELYTDWILPYFGPTLPLLAIYFNRKYPKLTQAITPILTQLVTPAITLILIVYLFVFFTKPPINQDQRDTLILFDVILIITHALIIFSSSDFKTKRTSFRLINLIILAGVAIFIDVITLSGVIMRPISLFTPNRLTIISSNLLILIHLMLILRNLIRLKREQLTLEAFEIKVSKYLPVYVIWLIVIVFVLPWLY